MSTNLPLGDYVRIALVTGVVLVAMALMAGWLIEHSLRPVLDRLWPVRGRHVASDYHPLDEEETDERADTPDPGSAAVPDGGVARWPNPPGDVHLPGASGPLLPAPMRGVRQDVGPEQHGAEADELTAEPGDEWPDALRDLNAEHLVKPHDPPPDLDTLDLMIEAARQTTTADPQLLPMIREKLGFDSVDCYLDSMRRKLARAGAA